MLDVNVNMVAFFQAASQRSQLFETVGNGVDVILNAKRMRRTIFFAQSVDQVIS
jgi:hypothetical protein